MNWIWKILKSCPSRTSYISMLIHSYTAFTVKGTVSTLLWRMNWAQTR